MSSQVFSSMLLNFVPKASRAILLPVDYYFQQYADQFNVNTDKRIAAFFAQAAHETMGFTRLRELGNDAYFAKYDGRKDLGNTVKGDGAKFKGRGIFQTTGRYNYGKVSQKIFGDSRLLDNPGLLEQPEYAVLSALHFWNDKNLNAFADSGNFTGLTKAINGGANGLTERKNYWQAITNLLSLSPVSLATTVIKKKVSNGYSVGRGVGSGIGFFIWGK